MALAVTFAALAGGAGAEQLTLQPSKDNTLYESASGSASNGAGDHFFSGRNDQSSNSLRRGVLAFDLGAIPDGSTVTSAALTLHMSRSVSGSQQVSLHRLTQDWGEGSSNADGAEGRGTSPASGDASWVHTFFGSQFWNSPGGDFVATASATTSVAGEGDYTWSSTTQLVSDVQGWVDDPSSNFGWLLRGNEAMPTSAKRFDSRESTNPPVLVVNYTPPVAVPGTVQMATNGYQVNEGAGTLNLEVTRTGGGDGAVSVAFATVAGTATEGLDYLAASGTLSWGDGEQGARPLTVTILDDTEEEIAETFSVTLSNATGGAAIASPSAATVTIVDDDAVLEAGTLAFAEAGFLAGEADGSATVTVVRSGGGAGQVTVDYATSDLSATAGSDYTFTSGSLVWADGEQGAKTFMVPIADDGEQERSELLRLVLSNPTGGAATGEQDTAVAAIADDDGPGVCLADGARLCLFGDRFMVEAEWRNQRNEARGLGTAVADSDKSGFFWFFGPSNVELIVKVLDGRVINDSFWFFSGALSDVEYWIVVTDTVSDQVRLYRNAPGNICGVGDTMAFAGGGPSTFTSSGSALSLQADGMTFAPGAAGQVPGAAAGSCVEDSETLCLFDARFQVTVDWRNQRTDVTGVGHAVPGTDNSGYFWFFDPENLELVVKVLDGASITGKFWVFYGALSDVEYTIRVEDTATGAVKQYRNIPGNICGAADTAAFDP